MIPITKNEASVSKQIISVINADGSIAGTTYPKRAAGLVKKGRAQYVSDFTIRLNYVPDGETYITEEFKMNNTDNKKYIFFEPKRWQNHPDVDSTVYERFFIDGVFDSGLTEIITIGDWRGSWSEITNGMLSLEKNTEYHFVFWLNGGENDRFNEVCQLHVMFTDSNLSVPLSDWNNKLVYKLNRAFIKPLKHYKGWELYDIQFTTQNNEFTQLRFVAQFAPMSVMAAKEPETYVDLPDIPDEYADLRPQRHNIVFTDGFPVDKWYGTKQLIGRVNDYKKSDENAKTDSNNFQSANGDEFILKNFDEDTMENIGTIMHSLFDIFASASSQIDTDEIVEKMMSGINDNARSTELDEDAIRNTVEDAVSNAISDLEGAASELEDKLTELKEVFEDAAK